MWLCVVHHPSQPSGCNKYLCKCVEKLTLPVRDYTKLFSKAISSQCMRQVFLSFFRCSNFWGNLQIRPLAVFQAECLLLTAGGSKAQKCGSSVYSKISSSIQPQHSTCSLNAAEDERWSFHWTLWDKNFSALKRSVLSFCLPRNSRITAGSCRDSGWEPLSVCVCVCGTYTPPLCLAPQVASPPFNSPLQSTVI